MSRIGRAPVKLPKGVSIEVKDNVLKVVGNLGTLTQDIDPKISFAQEGDIVTVSRANDEKEIRAKHGLYRALLQNMVIGVTKGYEKSLVVNGVGYKVSKQGNKIVLNVGYSHPIEYVESAGIKLECPADKEILIKGINKVDVGQVAANIRAIRKPEPYHGYGIRYKDEVIERKEGKTAGK